MSSITGTDIEKGAKQAAKKVEYSPLVETLTRLGYAVRGVIYFMIGLLALRVVIGQGGKLANPQDAIATLGKSTVGILLLWIILIGLISYSLWGLIRAFLDPLHKGHDVKGLLERFGFIVSAFGYMVLVAPTLRYIQGNSASSSQTPHTIFQILSIPFARWVVGIVGLGVVAGGLYQMYLGIKAHFDHQFQIYALNKDQLNLATSVARFGTAARGVVFAVTGILMILSAYHTDPNKQIGINAALNFLLQLPYGLWLLAFITLGLMSFGIYSLLSALWFRLKR
jgi:hypothetical protein